MNKLIRKACQFAYKGSQFKLIRKLICFAYQFIHQKSNLIKFCLEIERLIWKAYQFAYQFIFQAFIAYKWKLIRLLIRFAYQFTKSPVKPLPFCPSQSRHLILKNPLNRQLLKKLIRKAYQFAYQFKLRTLIGEKQKLIRKLICFRIILFIKSLIWLNSVLILKDWYAKRIS